MLASRSDTPVFLSERSVFVIAERRVICFCDTVSRGAAAALLGLVPSPPGKDSRWWNFHWAHEAERSFIIPRRVASACADIVLSRPTKSGFDVLIGGGTYPVWGWALPRCSGGLATCTMIEMFWINVALVRQSNSSSLKCQYSSAFWLKLLKDGRLWRNADRDSAAEMLYLNDRMQIF